MDFKIRMSLLSTENHRLRAENSALKVQCEALRTENEELSAALAALRSAHTALRTKYNDLDHLHDQFIHAYVGRNNHVHA